MKSTKQKVVTHGGVRPGAGRKALDPVEKKVAISVRLPPQIVTWLKSQDRTAAVLIEEAVVKHFKLTKLKPKG